MVLLFRTGLSHPNNLQATQARSINGLYAQQASKQVVFGYSHCGRRPSLGGDRCTLEHTGVRTKALGSFSLPGSGWYQPRSSQPPAKKEDTEAGSSTNSMSSTASFEEEDGDNDDSTCTPSWAISNPEEAGPKHGLSLSLFHTYDKLPLEGQVTQKQSAHSHQTMIYTYESACASCHGTGSVKPYGHTSGHTRRGQGGRHRASTCMSCHGIGYVRHTTTRFEPCNDRPTLNRPPPQPEQRKGPNIMY